MPNIFQYSLNLLEEELNDVSYAGAEVPDACLPDETPLSTPAKILVGATSPLWVPVGLVGLVIGMPVLGALVFTNKVTDSIKLRQYQNYPREYFTKRCKKFITLLTEDKAFEYTEWMLQRTTETLYTYKRSIPTRIKADREMMSQLYDESRDKDEVLMRYNPIEKKSLELRRNMLQLGFRLCPATVDERHLEWQENQKSVLKEEEFATVYHGSLKNCGRIPKHGPDVFLRVAVKVFRRPFDDAILRLYLDEELNIR